MALAEVWLPRGDANSAQRPDSTKAGKTTLAPSPSHRSFSPGRLKLLQLSEVEQSETGNNNSPFCDCRRTLSSKTIVPRLRAHGADMDKVRFIELREALFSVVRLWAKHMNVLKDCITEADDVKLLILDALSSASCIGVRDSSIEQR